MEMTRDLAFIFSQLLQKHTQDDDIIEELWKELVKKYSQKKRHYHTLQHLENLLLQLEEVKEKISDWDVLLFSVFYHDAIYNTLKSDNEERSADLAEKRMLQLLIDEKCINKCKDQILATKSHTKSNDIDSDYFTDADLSVLGLDWELYQTYSQNIRKEYSIYPDLVYVPGRIKVLNHFINMPRIFKTDYFYLKFEKQARANLKRELEILSA